MSDEEATEETPPLTPVEVEYEPATGMPPEFCEYLPKEDFLRALPWLSANRSFGRFPDGPARKPGPAEPQAPTRREGGS